MRRATFLYQAAGIVRRPRFDPIPTNICGSGPSVGQNWPTLADFGQVSSNTGRAECTWVIEIARVHLTWAMLDQRWQPGAKSGAQISGLIWTAFVDRVPGSFQTCFRRPARRILIWSACFAHLFPTPAARLKGIFVQHLWYTCQRLGMRRAFVRDARRAPRGHSWSKSRALDVKIS